MGERRSKSEPNPIRRPQNVKGPSGFLDRGKRTKKKGLKNASIDRSFSVTTRLPLHTHPTGLTSSFAHTDTATAPKEDIFRFVNAAKANDSK